MKFSRWLPGEPNNHGDEDCAHFLGDAEGAWNDVTCDTKMWFICEVS